MVWRLIRGPSLFSVLDQTLICEAEVRVSTDQQVIQQPDPQQLSDFF